MKIRYLLVTLIFGLLIVLALIPDMAMTQEPQGTSPSIDNTEVFAQARTVNAEESEIITFSEYPIGTSISNQYAEQGILFGGDNPFISTDISNPTTPVLSGSPRFRGAIEGSFVDPSDGVTPTIVESFKLDAGYFDEYGSTRIEWFDSDGNKLGQRTNSQFGIETFEITGGNIARWRTSVILTEPAGYAIDNVSFEPVQASVLFREKEEDKKDGSWGFLEDEIPGFDHTALHVDNLVYESHPGYPPGTYYSEDGQETASIVADNGVQAQHTKETFKHDATSSGAANSPMIDFEEIPIDIVLAESMRDHINAQSGATFQYIDFSTLEGIEQTLSPSAQKGDGGTFTCVGLVEWAAEQAGHHEGQGFIRNSFESILVPDFDWGLPPNIEFREFPLLSPELLNYSMKFSLTLEDINHWYQGIFDPVDFMITDPLGRKLGYTAALGEKNEIPNAFYSKNGKVEQFLIPNPVAGTYQIEFTGLGEQVYGAMASSLHSEGINTSLAQGEEITETFTVEMKTSAPGDVNQDGCINQQDITELSAILNTFTDDPNHPGDIDGNGIIEEADLTLLNELVALNLPCAGQVFIPIVLESHGSATSNIINGTVTDNSSLVFRTELLLRYFDGSAWSTYATTTTDSSGNYQFTNLPSLGTGQGFYVRWYNTNYDSSRLWTWGCWSITSSTTDPDLYQCDFDLDNVELVSPSHGATVALPHTFYWSRRSLTTDDYFFNLADVNDNDPWGYAPVGYVSNFTLNSIPTGFLPGEEYGWWMEVDGPDGYGISYYYRNVTFSSANKVGTQDIPVFTRISKEGIEATAPPQAK